MKQRTRWETTSFSLHILAMAFMLCDHLWATIVRGGDWLTCIGRIAFPLFAFMIVEGYFHTKKLKNYVLRLLVFAVISEIPFNLMTDVSVLNPFHQNVLWTFLIGLGLIHLIECAKVRRSLWLWLVTGIAIPAGLLIAMLSMVDYAHFGVLTMLVFYLFRGRRWWCFLGQLAGLWLINMEMIGGLVYSIDLLGREWIFPQQGYALLALIPIWLYRGKQGPYHRALKYTYYLFYPAHLLILYLLMLIFH